MLTPDELLHISEGAEELAEELHQDIIDRIIERILIRIGRGNNYILTAIDKWQIELLQDAGYLLEDIQKVIAERTPYLQTEIAEAMEDAGVRAISYDNAIYKAAGLLPLPLEQSPELIRIMQRNYEATFGELTNFTGTMVMAAQQAYIQACDKAYNQVLSGSLSYTQAAREAIMELVCSGVTVKYSSGHTDTIETAVRRAVRTGVSQASGQITDARMEEMDWDIILVSSHLGARVTDKADYTDHAWWQGKFYSKSGKDERFPPFSVCGMGSVQGIHGANCRHSHGPGDGENNPFEQYDSEENRKAYELQQRQQTLERRIRNTKREVMGLNTARQNAEGDLKDILEADYQRKAALLQKQNKAYNDFCEETGLKKRSDRISIAQWDRKQAAQARAAARRWNPEKLDSVPPNHSHKEKNNVDVLEKHSKIKERSFKSFATGEEVNDFFYYDDEKRGLLARKNSEYGKWKANLSEDSQKAIYSYTGSGYGDVNDYLRKKPGWESINAEMVEDQIQRIDEAIASFNLKENIVVQRGTSESSLDILFDGSVNDLSELIGRTYRDDGFMSSTALMGNPVATTKPVVFTIDIPAGQGRGAYINEFGAQFKDAEYEFLIKHGATFTITDVSEDVDLGKIYVKMVMDVE